MVSKIMKIPIESQLAQALAANEKKRRDGGMKKLKDWLAARSSSEDTNFSEDEIMKLWKGLFYCMWMSDKPLVQEGLADDISQLVHSFNNVDASFMFVECFFKTMNREWSGLDQWRMDKYMMFTRKFLMQCFALLKKLDWSDDVIERFSDIVSRTAARPEGIDLCVGFQIHVADIYVEELAKAASNKVPGQKLVAFFKPYCYVLAFCKTITLRRAVIRRVFEYAIRLSDPEDDKDEDEDDDVENTNNEEDTVQAEEYEESDEYTDDDEANGDDVILDIEKKWKRILKRHELKAQEVPFPKFDYKAIGDLLLEIVSKAKGCPGKVLKESHQQVKNLHEMAKNIFPLDVVPENLHKDDHEEMEKQVNTAVKDLYKFEKRLLKEKEEYATSKRRRKRKYSMPEDSDEDDDDDDDDDDEDIEEYIVGKEKMSKPELTAKKPTKKNKKQLQKRAVKSGSAKTVNGSGEPDIIKDKLMLRLLKKEAAEKKQVKKNMKRKLVEVAVGDKSSITPKNNKKLKKTVDDDDDDGGVTSTTRSSIKQDDASSPAAKMINITPTKATKANGNTSKELERSFENSENLARGSPASTRKKAESATTKVTKAKGRYFNETLLDLHDIGSAPVTKKISKASGKRVVTDNAKEAPSISLKSFKKSPPTFFQQAISKAFPKSGTKTTPKKSDGVSSPSRKVNFELTKIGAQEVKDYTLSVRSSPAIPFDSSKLPSQGVLKAGLAQTPSIKKRARAMEFF